MARPADHHLTREELESLALRETSRDQDSVTPTDDQADAYSHIAHCEQCRSAFASIASADAHLASLKLEGRGAREADCPSDEDLGRLAARILPAEQTEKYMQHAADCDHCGPVLKDLAEDFADELSSDEWSTLQSLNSGSADWQHQFAERLSAVTAAHNAPARAAISFWGSLLRPRFALAALGLAASVAAIWVGFAVLRAGSPDRLLAQAYTDHRTLETRLAGAKYAPVQVERGVARSSLDKSPYLLKAEALISENLQLHPDDPVWLAVKGRVEVLEGDSDDAISTLTRSLGYDPHSVQARIDLASAYFQRAQRPGRADDYGTAVECLSQVLKQNPNDPTALFNRAIVYEKLFLYDEAMRDWERYLQLDSTGGWAAEARSRADGVRQKMKSHDSLFRRTTPDPLQALTFLTPLRSVEPAFLKPPTEAMEENFVTDATTHWLPSLSSEQTAEGGRRPAHAESDVLTILADLMVKHHHDNWLRDLLTGSGSIGFARGVKSLAKAINANQENDSEQVKRSALEAISYFRTGNNKAGELRARFELIYALKRAQRGPECLAEANKLFVDLAGRSYSWLEVQTLLEQSNCLYMIGDFEAARRATDAALAKAESARYPTLYLRSLGFAAGLATNKGDTASSWQLDLKGLALYWSGPFDSLRAWQFYSDMGFGAEESSQWSLAVALARESVSSARATGRLGEEARARLRLATVASEDERFDEAAEQFRSANQLFGRLPQTASIRAFEADGEISLAEMEIERNQLSAARSVLNEVRSTLPQLESYSILLRYYKTLGRLEYLRGEDRQADSLLSTALYVSELGARSFSANDRDLLTWQRETRDLYRFLVELQLFLRKDSLSALQVWERYRALPLREGLIWQGTRRLGSHHQSHSPLSFEALQRAPSFSAISDLKEFSPRVAHETVLISYAWLTKGLAIWAADRAGVHTEWIPLKKEAFDLTAKRFLAACANQSSGIAPIRSDGYQLFGWLIAPIERYLQSAQQIVVETDESVSLIPFQALTDSSGEYIGTRWTFLYSPGVAYRRISHPSSVPLRNSRIVAVGVSAVGGDLAQELLPIPDAALEAEEVAGLFDKRTVLLDSDANRLAVQDALAGAEVFHFSGHSLVSTHQRGLLLASDPATHVSVEQRSVFFGPEEIRHLHMQKCRLIVLSACATASSEELFVSPEDLVGSFLRVGVHTVVASRWRVDSSTTRRFMNKFYKDLFKTANAPSALKLGASAMSNDSATSHPFYWAAFSAYGADLN